MLETIRYNIYCAFRDHTGVLPRLLSRGIVHPVIASDHFEFEGLSFEWTADIRTLAKAKQRGGVERRISRLAKALCKPGFVCLDVGSNYGFISSVMAAARSDVIAFEADPFIYSVMAQNAARFVNWDSRLAFVGTGEQGTFALDTLKDRSVAFLKIDTDGGDYDVLRGATAMLKRQHPVVCVECNDHGQEIYDLLLRLGYKHFYETNLMPMTDGIWPLNLVASVTELSLLPR